MLLKKKSEVDAKAVVCCSSGDMIESLAPQLDEAFGENAWFDAAPEAAVNAIGSMSESDGTFLVIAVDNDEPHRVTQARDIILTAKSSGMQTVLLAESLSPAAIHELMRAGADDFAPLPLPASALSDSLERLRAGNKLSVGERRSRNGLLYPVYGVAGGVGASTFAVNLAWETALAVASKEKRVAILDFNFQYGTVATYLDMPRREAIYELLSDTSTLDEEGLGQALTTYGGKMSVLTAPMDALPLDIIGPDDVKTLIDLARASYDYIFIDLPQALAHWSDLVLTESETFFAVMESDMRSAQNMLRFLRAVKAESLPIERVSVNLNRAPGFTDMSGKTRLRRLEESLGVEFAARLPDGGKQVVEACDQGAPLAKAAKNNALRKTIRKVAQGVVIAAETQRRESAKAV